MWLALLGVSVAGCEPPGRPSVADRYVPPHQERAFSVLYQQNCAGCHGSDGRLGPAPPLNDKLFLALIPDEELKRVITVGRRGSLMPAFAASAGGHLTAEQIDVLVEGVKRQWGAPQPPPSEVPPYFVAKDSHDGGAARNKDAGLQVFSRACSSCHGDHGQGGENGGEPVGAISDPDFLALYSDQALRRFVITGRSDLGMPDYADPAGRPAGFRALSGQEVTDVVALLASWRRAETAPRAGD
jgi:cytochrome c oxidase cbb3-type subunit 3/ubiquinol-cytochrome c reductase cytochrome c subunit